jgi:hypothetical protein
MPLSGDKAHPPIASTLAVSDLLRQLPSHGVGAVVTRDTWHPAGNKYWEIVEVVPLAVRHGAANKHTTSGAKLPHASLR